MAQIVETNLANASDNFEKIMERWKPKTPNKPIIRVWSQRSSMLVVVPRVNAKFKCMSSAGYMCASFERRALFFIFC